MKPVKHWFGLGLYDEYTGHHYHWWNRCYEFHGSRVRLMVGDILASSEDENGCHIGPQFEIALHLSQEDIPEFYMPDNPKAQYDIHTFTAIFWRWGIYLSIRGRIYA